MSGLNVIRAWKDEEYRASLSDEELAVTPPNPAGAVGILSVMEVNDVDGPPGTWLCNSGLIPCSLVGCPSDLLGGIICPIWF